MRNGLLFAAVLLVAACGRINHPTPTLRAPSFITGTYVTYEKSRFCVTWDTLIISKDISQQNLYAVDRQSAYQWSLERSIFPVQTVWTGWKGVYDDSSHILNGIHADNLQFFPEQNTVRLSGVLYWRVE